MKYIPPAFLCLLVATALTAAAPIPAHAGTVAEDLITILEQNGQLSHEQARDLRDKAVIERETLKRDVLDEVQVQAEAVATAQFQNVATGDKATVTASLADSMHLGGYLQVLASVSDNDSPANLVGDRASGVGGFETSDFRETDGFSMRRARMKLSGNVGPRTKYLLQFDADGIDDPTVTDALNLNAAYMDTQPAFMDGTALDGTHVRAGLFKVQFSKEETGSSSKRLTIARSQFVNELTVGREVGVMVYNEHLADDRVAAYTGMTNGAGENEDDNDPFLWFARGEYRAIDGATTEFGEANLLLGAAIAGSVDANGANVPFGGVSAGFDIADPVYVNGQDGEIRYRGERLLLTADASFEVGRFGLLGEVLYADYDVRNSFAPTPGAGSGFVVGGISDDVILARDDEFMGFHVVPSYWIIENTLQGVFKYEYVKYGDVLDAEMWGTTVGLNYHLLPNYRSMVRANWVHLNHESDVVTLGRADDLEQDFFLLEWQTKF